MTGEKIRKPLDISRCYVYIASTMQGEELRRIRGLLNMTQRELSEALDVAKDTVARMERGEMAVQRVTELAVRYLLLVEKTKGGKRKWQSKN